MPPPTPKPLKPLATGLASLDSLAVAERPVLKNYVDAVSEYVLHARDLSDGVRKQAQIALSGGLARALCHELIVRAPAMKPYAGERIVAGALRSARADVSESHELDGLRLAIELKPVNLAVGRALWNRFGDVRAFAVNIHLKFPFAVVGGLLSVPTWEQKDGGTRTGQSGGADAEDESSSATSPTGDSVPAATRVSTRHLLERAEKRFVRSRPREIEADPAHLLEATGLIAYDPDTRTLDPAVPSPGSGLRWEEFLDRLVDVYSLRFEL